MNAQLGDFGIANHVVDSRSIVLGHSNCKDSLAVTGTIGYMAPGINQECCHLLYLYKAAICYVYNNFSSTFYGMLKLFMHKHVGMFIALIWNSTSRYDYAKDQLILC